MKAAEAMPMPMPALRAPLGVRRWRAALAGALAIGALTIMCAGCETSARDIGARLFAEPGIARSDVNAFSCTTCHARGDAGDAIYAGFDLKDAAKRRAFWGGYSSSLLDATNVCLKFFMFGQPLTKEDPAGRALYEFLAEGGAEITLDPLPLTIVENVTTVARGSASRGAEVWDAACKSCHGDPHTGSGRLTELASIVPESSIEFAEQIDFPADLVLVEKVRHGGFFGVGGTMPPFAREQLSDEDLGALIAFLGL